MRTSKIKGLVLGFLEQMALEGMDLELPGPLSHILTYKCFHQSPKSLEIINVFIKVQSLWEYRSRDGLI